jgi:hypothetical protein
VPPKKPDRCTAKTRSGARCKKRALKGRELCRTHAGTTLDEVKAKAAEVLPRSRMKRLSADAQRRIDEALRDPGLLDLRRPVAIGQAIIEEAALIPEDDILRASIRRKKLRAVGGMEIRDLTGLDEWLEPTDAELEVERIHYLDQSMRLLERHANRQEGAAKSIEMGRMLNEQAIPMLAEMGTRVGRLVERLVPPERRAEFLQAFRQECRMIVSEIATLGDKRR